MEILRDLTNLLLQNWISDPGEIQFCISILQIDSYFSFAVRNYFIEKCEAELLKTTNFLTGFDFTNTSDYTPITGFNSPNLISQIKSGDV